MKNLSKSSSSDWSLFPRKRAEEVFEATFNKLYLEKQARKDAEALKAPFVNFYNWLFNKEGRSEGAPYVALPTLAVGVIGGALASAAALAKGDLEAFLGTSFYTILNTGAVAAMYNADQPGTWLYRNFGGAERTGRYKSGEDNNVF